MSHTELKNRSPITSATGRRYSRETPISPRRKSFAQLKNRVSGGTSTPQYSRSVSTCSGLMEPIAA